MVELISGSQNNTEFIGAELGKQLKGGDVVALFGDLGAGKTVFVKGLAVGMGIEDFVSSPTFALVHEYNGNPPLYHFDMYRISSWDDLYSTCFFDFLNLDVVIAIEWSENIESALPKDAIIVRITLGHTENERIITIIGGDKY